MEERNWSLFLVILVSIVLVYEIFLVGVNFLNARGTLDVDYSILSIPFTVSIGVSLGLIAIFNSLRLRDLEPNLSRANLLIGALLLIINSLIYFNVWGISI